jgi:hypothetical protein
VGDTIAQNCRVSNYAHGILTIETDNSAFATRLNFMSARILSNFRQNVLPELADIYIKVMPAQQYEQKSEVKPAKSRHISEQASQSLLEVAAHAPDSLKRKLEKLAAHVDKPKGK